jgi:hypothetical protein
MYCYQYHQTATAKWLKDVNLKCQIPEGFSVPRFKAMAVTAPSLVAFSRDDQASTISSPAGLLGWRDFFAAPNVESVEWSSPAAADKAIGGDRWSDTSTRLE